MFHEWQTEIFSFSALTGHQFSKLLWYYDECYGVIGILLHHEYNEAIEVYRFIRESTKANTKKWKKFFEKVAVCVKFQEMYGFLSIV